MLWHMWMRKISWYFFSTEIIGLIFIKINSFTQQNKSLFLVLPSNLLKFADFHGIA